MAEQQVAFLFWNDYTSVANFTLMFYDYMVLFHQEVSYVWKRPWSVMTVLYLAVRYLGLFLSVIIGLWGGLVYMSESLCHGILVFVYWGFSLYFCLAEVILIWRLHAIHGRSKRLMHILMGLLLPIVALLIATDIYLYSRDSAFSVTENISPIGKYCTFSYNIGPRMAIYTSIPVICYDILLVVVAAALLIQHIKEWKNMDRKPNSYVIMIVRYHMIYFVLNLTNQILLTILWFHIPTPVQQLSLLFNDTAPFILAPRLIISIWDTHANDECMYLSTTFEDCVCWSLPPIDDPEGKSFQLNEYGSVKHAEIHNRSISPAHA